MPCRLPARLPARPQGRDRLFLLASASGVQLPPLPAPTHALAVPQHRARHAAAAYVGPEDGLDLPTGAGGGGAPGQGSGSEAAAAAAAVEGDREPELLPPQRLADAIDHLPPVSNFAFAPLAETR